VTDSHATISELNKFLQSFPLCSHFKTAPTQPT